MNIERLAAKSQPFAVVKKERSGSDEIRIVEPERRAEALERGEAG
jgi:hypothetical protein